MSHARCRVIPPTLACLTALGLLLGSETASAQQSLANAANDPTASVRSFLLQNFYSGDYWNSDKDGNTLQFRAAIPFQIGGVNNIFRLTLPYLTDSISGDSGFSDTTIFDLATFNRSWGRFGVGGVALIPTGREGISAEKWAFGPAAGFVAQKPWGLWGLFNQNIFTVDGGGQDPDVNLSIIQPLFTYQLGNGWSAGASDMSITYDWERDRFSSLPLGLQINRLQKLPNLAIQYSVSYEHNFEDDGIAPKDTIGLIAKFMVPH